jgi:hypothetical protein
VKDEDGAFVFYGLVMAIHDLEKAIVHLKEFQDEFQFVGADRATIDTFSDQIRTILEGDEENTGLKLWMHRINSRFATLVRSAAHQISKE